MEKNNLSQCSIHAEFATEKRTESLSVGCATPFNSPLHQRCYSYFIQVSTTKLEIIDLEFLEIYVISFDVTTKHALYVEIHDMNEKLQIERVHTKTFAKNSTGANIVNHFDFQREDYEEM